MPRHLWGGALLSEGSFPWEPAPLLSHGPGGRAQARWPSLGGVGRGGEGWLRTPYACNEKPSLTLCVVRPAMEPVVRLMGLAASQAFLRQSLFGWGCDCPPPRSLALVGLAGWPRVLDLAAV